MDSAKHQVAHADPAPDIDCVVIGVNCSATIDACIASIRQSAYPADKLHLFYVDGGSSDTSIEMAQEHRDVSVIALKRAHPTPGLGRNHGWKTGRAPLVQFVDSDTIMDEQWLGKAVSAMSDQTIGAVFGLRKEMYPERSVYNRIGDIEWNGPAGIADCFGGDVMIRRQALETSGGYDELLTGGEDPELGRRIIRSGWHIIRLDEQMTYHDLAMTSFGQYLRRSYRSGYGFAAIRSREARTGSAFWQYDVRKIVVKGGGFLCSLLLSAALSISGHAPSSTIVAFLAPLIGSAMLLSPRLFRVGKFMREHRIDRKTAITYSWHCSLVVIPQLFGLARYHAGALVGRPMMNRGNKLKTKRSLKSGRWQRNR